MGRGDGPFFACTGLALSLGADLVDARLSMLPPLSGFPPLKGAVFAWNGLRRFATAREERLLLRGLGEGGFDGF
jgi:hypothetical protein